MRRSKIRVTSLWPHCKLAPSIKNRQINMVQKELLNVVPVNIVAVQIHFILISTDYLQQQ